MSNTLLPCPFCGGENICVDGYEHGAGLRWRIVCLDCMGMVDPGTIQQKYRAIEAWNRRAEPVPTVDAVEVVRCRDCVHFGECLVTENDYCSYGERKEDWKLLGNEHT